MDMQPVIELAFIIGLVGFGGWLTHLTTKLSGAVAQIDGRGEDIDEIRESVEIVAAILERLPDLLPQFHQHQSPLQPIIEWFVNKNMIENGPETLHAGSDPERDEAGKYATTSEETQDNETQI